MTPSARITLSVLAAVFVAAAAAGGAYAYTQKAKELESVRSDLASSTALTLSLQASLASTTQDRDAFQSALTLEQNKNQVFEKQISALGSAVGKLDKLSKTDPQLLAKYSKVYFLNENYIPSALSDIDAKYLFEPTRAFQIHAQVQNQLYDLLDDAKEDGIDLQIASAYRSFGTQAVLKASYKVTYGAGSANAFSADQGYSEHQLGTAVDFTTPAVGGTFVGFEKTDAYAWLNDHAYKYGFVISYPKSNGYYQFEPWHWRFVGEDLARKLRDENKYFYDLDQREINGYLGSLFD